MHSIVQLGRYRFGNIPFIGVFLIGLLFLFLTSCAKKVETVQETAESQSPTSAPQRPLQEEVLPPARLPAPPTETEAPGGTAMKAAGLEDAFFDFDKWTLRPDAKAALEKDALWLSDNPEGSIQIEGHCDERGTNEYNLALGERRAKAVKSYLVNLGVDAGRVSVVSFGEEKPFCTENTESCYQNNRRGHFVLRRP